MSVKVPPAISSRSYPRKEDIINASHKVANQRKSQKQTINHMNISAVDDSIVDSAHTGASADNNDTTTRTKNIAAGNTYEFVWPVHESTDNTVHCGQAAANTASNWVHRNNCRDEASQITTVTLSPNAPLKYNTEYYVLLMHGAPVLPVGDAMCSAYAYASAGSTQEDVLYRFTTEHAPPDLTKAEKRALYLSKRQNLRNIDSISQSNDNYKIDLKSIDWNKINSSPRPPEVPMTDEEIIEIDKTNIFRRKLMEEGSYIPGSLDAIICSDETSAVSGRDNDTNTVTDDDKSQYS